MQNKIKISKDDLMKVTEKGHFSHKQMEEVWRELTHHGHASPSRLIQVMYYFGALLIICALGWYGAFKWSEISGLGLMVLALSYGIVFSTAGYLLWRKRSFKLLGGLLVTVGVCMAPIVIFGAEKYMVFLTQEMSPIRDALSSLFIEMGTILTALIALHFVRFPFLTAPIAVSLWFMCVVTLPSLLGAVNSPEEPKWWLSAFVGFSMMVIAFFIDKRTKEDFAFWGYLFGALAFQQGIYQLTLYSEIYWVLYFVMCVGLMLASVFLERTALLVVGAIGVFFCVGHIFFEIFSESSGAVFALSLLGVVVIGTGLIYQKYSTWINGKIMKIFPKAWQAYLPSKRVTKK